MDSVVAVELEDSALQGLTASQQAFVRHIHSGLSATDSYKRAFPYRQHESAGIGQAASALLKDPMVQLKLKELRARSEEQSSLAPLLSREIVAEGIFKLARESQKDSVRLAAYIALGKTREINLFGSDPVEQKRERSPEDIDRQLLDLIRGMRATIDGNARDVTPSPEKEAPPKQQAATASRKRKPRA